MLTVCLHSVCDVQEREQGEVDWQSACDSSLQEPSWQASFLTGSCIEHRKWGGI